MTTLPEMIPLPPPPSMADPTTKGEEPKEMKSNKLVHHHQPWAIMITEAVKELNEKGGSSLPAIKKFVLSHNDVADKMLTSHMRRGMNSALAAGNLVQVKGHGLNGTFKLPGKKAMKGKPSKENDSKKMDKKKKVAKKDSTKKMTMKKGKTEKKVGEKKKIKRKTLKSPTVKKNKKNAPKAAATKKSAAPSVQKMKKVAIPGVAKMKATKNPKAPKPKTTKKLVNKQKAMMTPKVAKSPVKAKPAKKIAVKPKATKAGK